jgi:hypothetical protein
VRGTGTAGGAVTGNRREPGGSFALGPVAHVCRAEYGAIQLAGDGVFGAASRRARNGLMPCPLIGRDRKDWRPEQ